MSEPNLVVNDLDLIKHVLIRDFDHFIDRREFQVNNDSEVNKYFAHMLNNLKGEEWKRVRSALSPVFTSGKLKGMITFMNKVNVH